MLNLEVWGLGLGLRLRLRLRLRLGLGRASGRASRMSERRGEGGSHGCPWPVKKKAFLLLHGNPSSPRPSTPPFTSRAAHGAWHCLQGLKLIIGREKTLCISVPSLTDLSARTLPDIHNPVVVRLRWAGGG